MGTEQIGSVAGDWEPGSDLDWAFEIAQSFLAAALGDPPTGVRIDVVWSDHDLGSYPSLAVLWEDLVPEPTEFIRRAEGALNAFSDAIDWYRIRPSTFWPEEET